MNADAPHVMTVLGPIPPAQLGRTLIHEHLLFNLESYLHPVRDPAEAHLAEAPMTLENLWWVREHPMASRQNLVQADPALAAAEAARFKAAGGGTIVDVSSHGLARDAAGLRQIAERTGLNVVAGTGYYVGISHPPGLASRSVEDLTEEMVGDIENGIEGTGVRAGVIGEIGTSEPLFESERLVLRAAARAQRRTGVAMVVHPAPQHHSAAEFGRWLDILEDEGAIPSKVVLSHLEARLRDAPDDFAVLARRGYVLALDTWGNTCYYESRGYAMPSDDQRIALLTRLVRDGLGDHLVLAQDVCYRHALTAYGGPGYAHLLRDLWPRLLAAGIPSETLDRMLADNPRRALTVGA
ncbi:MAG: phosphotriesterase-related protein [Chloroflexi bacterium]|nr:phosphotriesterase-related protein [Chloroflexota bacterium]